MGGHQIPWNWGDRWVVTLVLGNKGPLQEQQVPLTTELSSATTWSCSPQSYIFTKAQKQWYVLVISALGQERQTDPVAHWPSNLVKWPSPWSGNDS